LPSPDAPDTPDLRGELGEVVAELAKTHHDLAVLMRQAPLASPRRLEHGFAGALRSSLDGEFRGTFDSLDWDAPPDACAAAEALAAITADLLLGAALEAVRNAGRHARGGDLHRRLHLSVALAADPQWVVVAVSDDGVGLQNEAARAGRDDPDSSISGPIPVPTNGGARTGLLTHGALLALVGGSLSVRSLPEVGTTVTVRVPRATNYTAAARSGADPLPHAPE
jgi:signal transduction histidine kinase